MSTERRGRSTTTKSAAPILRIQLLGHFAVSVGDRPIPESAWPTRKAQQLVKLLALAPGYRLTRDQVFETLWPDQDPDSLAAAFYQTCYLARRALGHPDYLVVRGGSVALAPPDACQVDSVAFERATAGARHSEAIDDYVAALDRYTGDLLPEERYADWAIAPADRLRGLATALRRELAVRREAAGDDRAAESLWDRILADDLADEAAHIGLMRLYARRGQRQRATRQYHLLHARLRDELDIAPSPAAQQLYAAILGGQFPAPDPPPAPVPSPALPPHALPIPLTALIGRGTEIAAVSALLSSAQRLVTLTGAGGCGKSRLALAVAGNLLPAHRDGVWWVPLAPLPPQSDVTSLADTIARVLGVRLPPGQEAAAALPAALSERDLLLVLDNAEHLRDACAALVATLLASCPRLRILVTSRAVLRVPGEQIWRVPTLPVPDQLGMASESLGALAENDAVRLFVARAGLVRPGFALKAANAPGVVSICRQVEGLPLALELAAARVTLLEPRQLAARLGDALGLLTDGAHGLSDHQRTLRATLDWSWALLAKPEQQLLARLAVFAGGWTLEAAEAICGDGTDVLANLAGLVEHSLVQVEPGDGPVGEPRYRLLEPVRQYAAEHLSTAGESDALRHSHARFFLALAERAEPEFYREQQDYWGALLARDYDNVRAALHWLDATGDREALVRLFVAFHRYWYTRGGYPEGRRWAAAALRVTDAAAPGSPLDTLRPAALYCAGTLTWPAGELTEARGYFEQALALAQARGLVSLAARCQLGIGIVASMGGDYGESRRRFEESLVLARQIDDRWLIGVLLNNLGLNAMWRGDVDDARSYQVENLALCRATSDTLGIASALANLCEVAYAQGDLAAVVAYADEALALFTSLGERRGMAVAHNNRATAAAATGDYVLARQHANAALTLYQEIGNTTGVALARRILAETATALGEIETACAHFRLSLEHYRETQHPRDVIQCLESLAELAQHRDDWADATRFMAAAEALRASHDQRPLPADQLRRDRLFAGARAALGDATFDADVARGSGWSVSQAVAEALAYLP